MKKLTVFLQEMHVIYHIFICEDVFPLLCYKTLGLS